MTTTQLIDEYFLENRHKLLDIAAFLDRLDAADDNGQTRDFRMKAFGDAIAALASGGGDRVQRIQLVFSDPRSEPLAVLDRKAARGAYDRLTPGERS
jgi:hypothetical protein